MRKRFRRVVVVLCGSVLAIMAGPGSGRSTPPTVPLVTKDSIVGTWESVLPEGPTIHRLDIRRKSPSYVSLAIWTGGPPEAAVYLIKKMTVDDGVVNISADDLKIPSFYSLTIDAKGSASEGTGTIDAVTTLYDRKEKRSVRQWRSTFVLTKMGYVNELTKLVAAADAEIREADRIASGRPTPSLTGP
jgi:hypothetical protein